MNFLTWVKLVQVVKVDVVKTVKATEDVQLSIVGNYKQIMLIQSHDKLDTDIYYVHAYIQIYIHILMPSRGHALFWLNFSRM